MSKFDVTPIHRVLMFLPYFVVCFKQDAVHPGQLHLDLYVSWSLDPQTGRIPCVFCSKFVLLVFIFNSRWSVKFSHILCDKCNRRSCSVLTHCLVASWMILKSSELNNFLSWWISTILIFSFVLLLPLYSSTSSDQCWDRTRSFRVLVVELAGVHLCGFALACDQHAKASAFVFNAKISNCVSEVSCSVLSFSLLLLEYVTNLFRPWEFLTHEWELSLFVDSILISTPY